MTEQHGSSSGLLAALLALGLLAALVLGPALFGDRALVGVHTDSLTPWRGSLPSDAQAAVDAASLPILADKTIQFWPLLDASLGRLFAGEAPLWNPRNLGGVPLLAQGFQGTLHPVNWLARVLDYASAFGWIAWCQALMAGLFAWALARELGLGRAAALLAGSTWMLCGYLTARWHWYMIQGCSSYLPLALWGVERSLRLAREPDARDRGPGPAATVALTALAVGLAWLTGWLQGALHLVYLCGVWGLVRVLPAWLAGGAARRQGWLGARRCAMALALGLALASPQLLPTLEWVASGESARDTEPAEVVAGLGQSPLGLLGLLSPDNLGHPLDVAEHPLPALRSDGALRRLVHQRNGNFVETNGFVGVIALVLAAFGAWRAARGRGLAVGLLLAGLVLSLKSPLLLLVARLPGLASGDPLRFLLLFSIGATLLAALGLERLLREGSGRRPVLLTGALALLAAAAAVGVASLDAERWSALIAPGLAQRIGVPIGEITQHADALVFDRDLLAGSLARLAGMLGIATVGLGLALRWARLGAALLLVAALGEQALAAARNAVTVPAAGLFAPPPRAAELAAGGRLVPFHPAGPIDPLGTPFPGNTALPSGIDDLSGYWALAPRRMIHVLEGLQPGTTFGLGTVGLQRPELLASPVLDALAVRQVLASIPLDVPGWHDAGALGEARLYRRDRPSPEAWFSLGRAVPDEQAALSALLTLEGDPRSSTPLSPLGALRPPTHAAAVHSSVPTGDRSPAPAVTLTERSPEEWLLELDAPHDGVVVVAHTWSPGWSATLDGAPTTLWPAWHVLQAVEVPAGRHAVVLRYDSPGWRIGRLAAPAALLALALHWLRERRARRRTVRTGCT